MTHSQLSLAEIDAAEALKMTALEAEAVAVDKALETLQATFGAAQDVLQNGALDTDIKSHIQRVTEALESVRLLPSAPRESTTVLVIDPPDEELKSPPLCPAPCGCLRLNVAITPVLPYQAWGTFSCSPVSLQLDTSRCL